jgi:hypothetical protein
MDPGILPRGDPTISEPPPPIDYGIFHVLHVISTHPSILHALCAIRCRWPAIAMV